jgi:excisionase family DNA binding protein
VYAVKSFRIISLHLIFEVEHAKILGMEPNVAGRRLLTVKDAAEYLSCTIWAVRELAWAQKVPSIKIGRRLLFDIRDLDAFVETAKVPAL